MGQFSRSVDFPVIRIRTRGKIDLEQRCSQEGYSRDDRTKIVLCKTTVTTVNRAASLYPDTRVLAPHGSNM